MTDKIFAILSVLTVCVVVLSVLAGCSEPVPQEYVREWSSDAAYGEQDYTVVQPDSEQVRILQLTDVHYDDNNNRKQDTLALIRNCIESAKPDMIALTGDWCSNAPDREANSREVFDTIDSFGIPWAPVFGNHDREGKLSGYDFADIFAEYEHCLFDAGYSNIGGQGNYTVVFRNAERMLGAAILLDTHSSVVYGLQRYQHMTQEQIDWYRWTVDGLDGLYKAEGNTQTVPTLMYTHIPINEYVDADNSGEVLLGSNGEKCWVPAKNSGMFTAVTDKQSTRAIFAGHDHANNSVIAYQGVQLVYGVQSGWCQNYADDCLKGATLATLQDSAVQVEHVLYDAAAKKR